jgi:hypothetical protein
VGHHIFEFEGRFVRMHDSDVKMVNHFLKLAASRIGDEQALMSLRQWECIGTGVWMGVDERALATSPQLFPAAESELDDLGAMISVDYLRSIPGLDGSYADWPARPVIEELRKLRRLFDPAD